MTSDEPTPRGLLVIGILVGAMFGASYGLSGAVFGGSLAMMITDEYWKREFGREGNPEEA